MMYYIYHDITILKKYGVTDFKKVYDSYTIYKTIKTPHGHINALEEFKYDPFKKKFVSVLDSLKFTETNIPEKVKVLDITCEKKPNIQTNDELSDDSSLTEKLEQLQQEIRNSQKRKEDKLNYISSLVEKNDEDKDILAEKLGEEFAFKKTEKYEKEKFEQRQKKFIADKNSYLKIKDDIEKNCFDVKNIPSFFINIFQTLSNMEKNNELNSSDAYDKFIKSYTALITSKEGMKEEDDSYGIIHDIELQKILDERNKENLLIDKEIETTSVCSSIETINDYQSDISDEEIETNEENNTINIMKEIYEETYPPPM